MMDKHIGAVECFCHDKKTAGFAALEHIAEFKDGKAPVQLMVKVQKESHMVEMV